MPRITKSAVLATLVISLAAARSASAQMVDPPGGDPHGCVPVIGETHVSTAAWSPSWWTSLRLQLTNMHWAGLPARQVQAVRGPARLPQAILRKRR